MAGLGLVVCCRMAQGLLGAEAGRCLASLLSSAMISQLAWCDERGRKHDSGMAMSLVLALPC